MVPFFARNRSGRLPTIRGLILMAGSLLLFFAVIALVRQYTDLGRSVPERAQKLYRQGKSRQAEILLVRYLQRQPDDNHAWILLARGRGRVRAALHNLSSRHPDSRITADSLFQLTDDDFTTLLGKSPHIDPAVLRGWFLLESENFVAARGLLDTPQSSADRLFALGEMARQANQPLLTLDYFRRAVKLDPGNGKYRRKMLHLVGEMQMYEKLLKLMEQTVNRQAADSRTIYLYRLRQHRYLAAFPYLVKSESEKYDVLFLLAALLSGTGWFIFCWHAGNVTAWSYLQKLSVILAPLLGAASTYACLFLIPIEHDLLGFDAGSDSMFFRFINAVLGIGLREEFVKLLFFIPLHPLLLRMRDDRMSVIVASLAGLGFAVEENIGYFYQAAGGGVVGRFLTANFFHMALTGYAGYYLHRALRLHREQEWPVFLEKFGLVVLMHGLYDFFLMEQQLAGLNWLAYTVYIWLSREYLGLLLQTATGQERRGGLTRKFIFALTLAIGTGIVLVSEFRGPGVALTAVAGEFLGVVFISFMFFREFNERLTWK